MPPASQPQKTADTSAPNGRAPAVGTAGRDAAVEAQRHLAERIEWEDLEASLDEAGDALIAIASDRDLLQKLAVGIDADDFDPHGGSPGAYWFHLLDAPAAGASLWLRYCPSGSVVTAHAHDQPFAALVINGTFKQTLIGVGGGVASSVEDVELYVRHEGPGQVFALRPGQRHSSCSSAESLLCVLTPRRDGPASRAATASDDAAKLGLTLRRLRQTIAHMERS